MSNQKYTPAIPPLSGISDANTRKVLEALANGWRTRNGDTNPDSDERFITKGELANLVQKHTTEWLATPQGQSAVSGATTGATLPNQQVEAIVTRVQQSVLGSTLWRELGEKIPLINVPQIFSRIGNSEVAIKNEVTARTTADTAIVTSVNALGVRVGNNEAAIVSEQTARVNADNAITQSVNTQFATVNSNVAAIQSTQTTQANQISSLSSSVTTLQATTANNTTAIQTEQTARISADNDIYSKYSVKIDTNGYVSGFGLISTANNGTPVSDFIIRADRFAIGSPSGPGITPRVPFVVLTTTDANGNPPGVYIDSATIRNATISAAKITNTIQSDNYVAGSSGWFIRRSDGFAEFGNIVARGNITANSLTANTVNTENIVGAAVTNAASAVADFTQFRVSVTVTIPSGVSTLLLLGYSGDAITTAGETGETTTQPTGTLWRGFPGASGSVKYGSGTGSISFPITSPAAGTYTFYVDRNIASNSGYGNVSIAVLTFKR